MDRKEIKNQWYEYGSKAGFQFSRKPIEHPYALYTRYPRGITPELEAEDLCCPKCGAQEIIILKESPFGSPAMMGDEAQCWICKHEFIITENSWKLRRIEE